MTRTCTVRKLVTEPFQIARIVTEPNPSTVTNTLCETVTQPLAKIHLFCTDNEIKLVQSVSFATINHL